MAASAAWSVPVVAAAVAAPLASASPVFCRSATMFTRSTVASNPTVLSAVSTTGVPSTVRITSVLAPGTTTETEGQSFNLTRDTVVWSGFAERRSSYEAQGRGGWVPGSLVLNQRRAGSTAGTPTAGSPAQTLMVEFFDKDGRPFAPVGAELTFSHIDSRAAPSAPWFVSSWDTVGFSTPPVSISSRGGSAGTGAGTVADPFRRATGDEPAGGEPLFDTFAFDVLPSGSTFVCGQHEGRQGWQSLALSALSFRSTDC
ncbi:hypothetical protein [Rathayibacter sp. VKM Ac-2857]|uniref:hypothetical protein n=1 Tax=Rathayibacter sp. VKM Ac-2857 TaxID=2739020 RepID=UPI0015648BDC|nr:hypothetical protein [Rathayibacter sp. VKM Ac-2857]NQX15570.1 hypothetical protein [Rathayibacter sp. VKM Ac-2857]